MLCLGASAGEHYCGLRTGEVWLMILVPHCLGGGVWDWP